MTTAWGWCPERTQGIWRHGARWFRPLAAAAPWVTLVLCVMLMYAVGDTLTSAKGVLFDLPESDVDDGVTTALVATVMPLKNETTVFFDDARYALRDGAQGASFGEQLSGRLGATAQKTLLVLADRRVSCDDLMRLCDIARKSGVKKVLFANKREEARGE